MPTPNLIGAHTFSLCTVDPDSGEAGVCVASRCLAVGGLVPFAAAGVGAIASQAVCRAEYGRRGLALLATGLPAEEVLRRLVAEDVTVTDEAKAARGFQAEGMTEEGVDFVRGGPRGTTIWFTSRIRQVGIVDGCGRAAVHTGRRTRPWAGALTGPGFCCQGNLLVGEEVLSAMVEAFEARRRRGESMAARLLAALQGGEAAGGDRRGKQAAGILIVNHQGSWAGSDRWCDLRVDDHEEPVAELARILKKAGYVE